MLGDNSCLNYWAILCSYFQSAQLMNLSLSPALILSGMFFPNFIGVHWYKIRNTKNLMIYGEDFRPKSPQFEIIHP